MDKRILVFTSQAAATAAVSRISTTIGLTGSTFLFAVPQALADGRWFIPRPTDDSWMAGVSGHIEADSVGLAAVGEAERPTTLIGCLDLADRFTADELGRLTLAASHGLEQNDPRLQVLLDTMGRAVQLDVASDRVQDGFAGVVAMGLLTRDRANAILSPTGLTR